ncbi:hypothetical protein M0813_03803 [Anaeramoeba flamelloides]|uniref:Uncharacterized protein n=1 Tax=Anaeramoeba flamelloides TaxID=1746091 RepID=A0ABQ8XR82_9EUKA|nr:hypothetical protein M0813_03803 [Anaeramoeba flamelloides]
MLSNWKPLLFRELGKRSNKLHNNYQLYNTLHLSGESSVGLKFSTFASIQKKSLDDLSFYSHINSAFNLMDHVQIKTSVTSQKQATMILDYKNEKPFQINAGVLAHTNPFTLYTYFNCKPKYFTFSLATDPLSQNATFSFTTGVSKLSFGVVGKGSVPDQSLGILESAMHLSLTDSIEIHSKLDHESKLLTSNVFTEITPKLSGAIGMCFDLNNQKIDNLQASLLTTPTQDSQVRATLRSSGNLSLEVFSFISNNLKAGLTTLVDFSKIKNDNNISSATKFGFHIQIGKNEKSLQNQSKQQGANSKNN